MSDFNKLWAGQAISVLGSAVTTFALPTVAVLRLHATPLQIGLLTALGMLPFPILGVFVGVLADRVSRRTIMIASDVVRFFVLATVPIAAALGTLHLPQLYLVALINGAASVFFGIAYQSYLPVLVATDGLRDANAKLELSNSGASMAGSALAGSLIGWIGGAAAIAIDAISYLASVGSLVRIRTEEPPHEGPKLSPHQAIREIRDGIQVVFRYADLRWIAGATGTINFGGTIVAAVELIYAYRTLHLKPAALGVVLGLAQIGFFGALLSVRASSRLGLRSTLVLSLLTVAAGSGGMLFARLGAPYVVLFLASALPAIATPIYNINQVSYRQGLVDVRMQGRMNATMRTLVWGTIPFGALVGGYLGGLVGPPATIAIGASICALSVLWLIPLRGDASHESALVQR